MREIKFRAWIKNQKRMNGWDGVDGTRTYLREMSLDKDVVLMQYTGLKDKNGKEIYEGDVVNSDWQHDGVTNYDYGVNGEIKWDDEKLQWSIECDKRNGEIWTYPIHSFEREMLLEDRIEVVGNIYENPELLNNLE